MLKVSTHLKTIGSLSCSLLLFGPFSVASEDDLWELDLDELLAIEITTVDSQPHNLQKLPATAYMVTQPEMKAGGYQNLLELLNYVPSVEYGYPHSWLQGGIRGFSDNWSKAKLLIDGQEVNLLFTGEAFIGHQFDLLNIERVEVIPGPASVQYGADAYTGVINLVTEKPLGGNFESGYETGEQGFHAWRAAGSYGIEADKLSLYGSFHYYDANDADFTEWVKNPGFSEPNQVLRKDLLESGTHPYEDRNRSYSIKLGMDYAWDEQQFLSLNYQRYFDRDGGGQESPEISFRDFYTERDQQVFSFSYHKEFTDRVLSFDLNLRYRTEDEFNKFNFREPIDGKLSPLYSYDIEGSDEKDINASLNISPNWNFGRVLLGIGNKDRSLVVPFFEIDPLESLLPFLDQDNQHAYLQYRLPSKDDTSEFFFGARRDWNNIYDDPNLIRSGYRYSFNENLTFKFLYGEAYRAPTLFELELNSDIVPSRMDTAELSIDYRFSSEVFLQLSFFENRASDLIVNRQITDDDQSTDLFTAFNEGKKKTCGVEAEVKYLYSAGQLTLWATSLGCETKFDVAEQKSGLRWMHRFSKKWEMGLSGKYTSEIQTKYVDRKFEEQILELPRYLNFDLKFSYLLNTEHNSRIWIRIRNLFDETNYFPNVRGIDPKQFQSMGRSFGAGASFSW